MAKRTAVGLNEIRKLINVEHKFVDVDSSTTSGIAGAIQYISPIAQGDNISEREGDSIKVQSFEITGTCQRDPDSTTLDTLRIMVVRDLQNQATAPTAAEILQTVSTIYAPFQRPDFLNGNDLNKRFSIVFEQLFAFDEYHPNQLFHFRSNHDCHVYYRGTGSTTASAGNGSYWFLAISNFAAESPIVDYNVRIRFTDN